MGLSTWGTGAPCPESCDHGLENHSEGQASWASNTAQEELILRVKEICTIHRPWRRAELVSVHQQGTLLFFFATPGDILGPQPVMETMLHAVRRMSHLLDLRMSPGDFLKQAPPGSLLWCSFRRRISYAAAGGPSDTTRFSGLSVCPSLPGDTAPPRQGSRWSLCRMRAPLSPACDSRFLFIR